MPDTDLLKRFRAAMKHIKKHGLAQDVQSRLVIIQKEFGKSWNEIDYIDMIISEGDKTKEQAVYRMKSIVEASDMYKKAAKSEKRRK